MRYILFFIFFFITLSADETTCYSVQLLSDTVTEKNRKVFSQIDHDATCKVLEIHNRLVMRCGCYDESKDAEILLQKYREKYNDAFVAKTFKYRFEEQIVPVLSDAQLQSEYDKAVDLFTRKDYAAVYQILSKLYLSKLSDVRLNFLLGRSAFETAHYEVALAAFERVDMLAGGTPRNKLEMARTYYMLKMYEEAQIAFKEVLQDPNLPKNVRTNVELYLSKVKKVQKKSFTYATASVDWIFDSNVNYASIDSQYTTSIGTFPSTAKLSDSAIQLYGDVTNVYDIGDKNGYVVKNRFTGMLKDYRDQNAFDLGYLSYSPSILYQYTKHLVEVGVGVDLLTIAKQDYLHSAYIMPSYEYSHTTTLKSTAYLKYQRKYFQRTAEYDLNADHYELSYALQKLLNPHSYTQGMLVALQEKKHHGTRVDVDYKEYKASVRYANQFNSTYATELFGEYKERRYSDFSTIFSSTREDSGVTLSGTLNIKVLQSLQFKMSASYNKVNSNQNVYSYKKHTLDFGLIKVY